MHDPLLTMNHLNSVAGCGVACALILALPLWPGMIAGVAQGAEIPPFTYTQPRKVCELSNPEIRESSGLAASRRHPGVLWTHNDSGDRARIFAFDRQGRDLGTCEIADAAADDWEDMASVRLDGQCCLLLADVGNNRGWKKGGILYLVAEPERLDVPQARLMQTVHFRYDDRPRDCEAVGFDPVRREVLLAVKQLGLVTKVYAFPWPNHSTSDPVVARPIGTIAVTLATAMDISTDGRRAVVLSYGDAQEFVREPDEDWQRALAKPGRAIAMPARRQGESICYGSDGCTLYLTSEGVPTPLFEVRVAERSAIRSQQSVQ
jgi:hypothetical protein